MFWPVQLILSGKFCISQEADKPSHCQSFLLHYDKIFIKNEQFPVYQNCKCFIMMMYNSDQNLKASVHSWVGKFLYLEDGLDCPRYVGTNLNNVLLCILQYITYLLTPWSRILLEKLTGSQLVKKFPAFYGIQCFITAFTIARHLSLP